MPIMVHTLNQSNSKTGVPPIFMNADGNALTAWSISGQTVQNGTPTPDAPIYPEFVGERTAQLLDKNDYIDGGDFYPEPNNSRMVASTNTNILLIPCKPSTPYTVSRKSAITKRFSMCFISTNQIDVVTPITGYAGSNYDSGNLVMSSTSSADSVFMVLYYAKHGGADSSTQAEIAAQLAEIMVNEGSTAKPYEPYGWAIETEVT